MADGGADPGRVCVHIDAAAAAEPGQRQANSVRQFDRERRRRADGRQGGDTRQVGLLHQLEGGATGDLQHRVRAAAAGPRAGPSPPPCPPRCAVPRLRAGTAVRPSELNRPAACTPPVRSKTCCCSRSRSGRCSSRSSATSPSASRARGGPSSAGEAERLLTASIDAVPQMPQALVVTTCRSNRGSGSATPGASCASTTLKVCRPSSSSPAQKRSESSCSGNQTMPSETRKPATRSKSSPGRAHRDGERAPGQPDFQRLFHRHHVLAAARRRVKTEFEHLAALRQAAHVLLLYCLLQG